MLLAEQEMLRIDCHQARAANYNHAGVLSVCSLLTVESGLYGGSATVMRDASGPAPTSESSGADDRDVRSRCSARHFIAWSQEVSEKFERLKVGLISVLLTSVCMNSGHSLVHRCLHRSI